MQTDPYFPERECARNSELQWLIGNLTPNYHSIADFRNVNPKALKNVFKLFVLFLKDAELVTGETVAIDGTKVRAHNSKKNNYSQKKIDRHLLYVEEKTNEYLQQLEVNEIEGKIERLKKITKSSMSYFRNNSSKVENLKYLLPIQMPEHY